MNCLVDVFENLIQEDWRLLREDAAWLVQEKNNEKDPSKNQILALTGTKMLGFSLDHNDIRKNPWPYFKPLKGIMRVNDAIIITRIQETHYVIAVELKSNNSGQANKQIKSAWYLMEYIRAILELNEHWKEGWVFCGLISSICRRQERKGTSRRQFEMDIHNNGNYRTGLIRNVPRLYLHDFHNRMSSCG